MILFIFFIILFSAGIAYTFIPTIKSGVYYMRLLLSKEKDWRMLTNRPSDLPSFIFGFCIAGFWISAKSIIEYLYP